MAVTSPCPQFGAPYECVVSVSIKTITNWGEPESGPYCVQSVEMSVYPLYIHVCGGSGIYLVLVSNTSG